MYVSENDCVWHFPTDVGVSGQVETVVNIIQLNLFEWVDDERCLV